MGPWSLRDDANPFRPGCSFETLRALVDRGRITRETILRGPSTRQFWSFARNAPAVANLLGECHSCHKPATPDEPSCAHCGAAFIPETDRQYLGLGPVHLLPGHAEPQAIVQATHPNRAISPLHADDYPNPPLSSPHPAPPSRREGTGFRHAPASLTPRFRAEDDELIAAFTARGRAAESSRRRATTIGITVGVLLLLLTAGVIYLTAKDALPPSTPGGTPTTGSPAAGTVAPTRPLPTVTSPAGGPVRSAPASSPSFIPPPSPPPSPRADSLLVPHQIADDDPIRTLLRQDVPASLEAALRQLAVPESQQSGPVRTRAIVEGERNYTRARLEQLTLRSRL